MQYLQVLVMVAKGMSTNMNHEFIGLAGLSVSGKEARTALCGALCTERRLALPIEQLVSTSQMLKWLWAHRTVALLPVMQRGRGNQLAWVRGSPSRFRAACRCPDEAAMLASYDGRDAA